MEHEGAVMITPHTAWIGGRYPEPKVIDDRPMTVLRALDEVKKLLAGGKKMTKAELTVALKTTRHTTERTLYRMLDHCDIKYDYEKHLDTHGVLKKSRMWSLTENRP